MAAPLRLAALLVALPSPSAPAGRRRRTRRRTSPGDAEGVAQTRRGSPEAASRKSDAGKICKDLLAPALVTRSRPPRRTPASRRSTTRCATPTPSSCRSRRSRSRHDRHRDGTSTPVRRPHRHAAAAEGGTPGDLGAARPRPAGRRRPRYGSHAPGAVHRRPTGASLAQRRARSGARSTRGTRRERIGSHHPALSRYQATVRSRPSSKRTCASQPSARTFSEPSE